MSKPDRTVSDCLGYSTIDQRQRRAPVSKQIKELFCSHQNLHQRLSGKWEFGQTTNQSDNRPEGVNPASLITWKGKKQSRPYIYLFLRVGDSYLPKVMKSAITRLFLTVSFWHHHGKRFLQTETFLWAGSQSLVQGGSLTLNSLKGI